MPESKSSAVDCHVHVFSVGAPSATDARYRPAYTAALESLRALWAAHGITHGVIVQPSFFGTDNAEMLAKVALLLERWAFDGVPPRQTAWELASTNHSVKALAPKPS